MTTYRLLVDGVVEVEASGSKKRALNEINHYAMMYSKEGKIEIKEVKD